MFTPVFFTASNIIMWFPLLFLAWLHFGTYLLYIFGGKWRRRRGFLLTPWHHIVHANALCGLSNIVVTFYYSKYSVWIVNKSVLKVVKQKVKENPLFLGTRTTLGHEIRPIQEWKKSFIFSLSLFFRPGRMSVTLGLDVAFTIKYFVDSPLYYYLLYNYCTSTIILKVYRTFMKYTFCMGKCIASQHWYCYDSSLNVSFKKISLPKASWLLSFLIILLTWRKEWKSLFLT